MLCEFAPPNLTQKDRQQADRYGGADTHNYQKPTENRGCDQTSHRERSESHQSNHADHWKKEGKP